jgi:PAS domain-containing protein
MKKIYPYNFLTTQYVLANRALRRIFGPKRDEVSGEWRKLHNEELHDLYSSRSIIRITKSRRMNGRGM